MRIGVFTPLLSQMGLVEEDESELLAFRRKLADYGFSIGALSGHGNPFHPDGQRANTIDVV
jgi:sugar phosphate isomerase/epimerase